MKAQNETGKKKKRDSPPNNFHQLIAFQFLQSLIKTSTKEMKGERRDRVLHAKRERQEGRDERWGEEQFVLSPT